MLAQLLTLVVLAGATTGAAVRKASSTAQLATEAIASSCDSRVYCNSSLLHHVQMARLYTDSKYFVDMRMLKSEKDVLAAFDALLAETNNEPSKEKLQNFVDQYFGAGNELEEWTPTDISTTPAFANKVKDPRLKKFGLDLNAIWPKLGRRMKDEVALTPDRFSIYSVPKPFVVPGGRFTEIYYWDSFWVIDGLIVCGMKDTARGMIENLLFLLKNLGLVPNGSRKYYQRRSQPPLLAAMVAKYMKATGDLEWLRKHIGTLESELEFWLNERSISVGPYTLLRYHAASTGPRPESYREDYTWVHTANLSDNFYLEIKSGAESGWDFSSRWYADPNSGDLSTINITRIIPVDLNAIFADYLQKVSDFRSQLGDHAASAKWRLKAAKWRYAIESVLWDPVDGTWYDYDINLNRKRKFWFASNASPLWIGAVEKIVAREKGRRFLQYLKKSGALAYEGGVPASLRHTGEQWDFPNAWPPLESIVIDALENSGNDDAKKTARQLAATWLRSNYIGFRNESKMFEKYNVLSPGKRGEGGEYTVQEGFGWTNGVVLVLIDRYGSEISLNDTLSEEESPEESSNE